MRKVPVALWILVPLLLTACARHTATERDGPLYSKTPEDAVEQAFAFCRDGKYQEAVRLYVNGPQMLSTMPDVAKSMVDRACFTYKGTATRYVILRKEERGEGANIDALVFVYPPDDHRAKNELNSWGITLIRKPEGWLIAT